MEDKPRRLVKNVSANREGTCHCESRRRRSNLYFQLGTAFLVINGLKVVLVEDSSRFARDPIAQELGVLMLIKRNPQPVSAVGGRLDPGPLPSRLAGVSLFGSRLHLAKNYQSLGRVFLIKGSLFVSLRRMIRPSSTAVLSQASVAESSVVLPPERAGTNADHSNLFRTAFPAGHPSQHVNCV